MVLLGLIAVACHFIPATRFSGGVSGSGTVYLIGGAESPRESRSDRDNLNPSKSQRHLVRAPLCQQFFDQFPHHIGEPIITTFEGVRERLVVETK